MKMNLRWAGSVRLVAFVLIAVLAASGVAATVWAQATGGGAAGPAASPPQQPATGTIVIIKKVVPNDTQVFSFSGSGSLGPFKLDDDGISGNTFSNTRTFVNLPPDVYTVFEEPLPGQGVPGLQEWYLIGSVCVYPGGITVPIGSLATINLVAGATVTCTFTNYKAGRVIVKKVIDPANDPTVFQFNAAWPPGTFSLAHNQVHDSGLISPSGQGNFFYLLAEATVGGWIQTAACADPDGGTTVGPTIANPTLSATGVSIDLDPGETITCTFTNRKAVVDAPDLAIEKVGVVSTDGQTVTYTLTVTNKGTIPVLNPHLSDILISPPPGSTFVFASGPGWSCTPTPTPGPVACDYAGIFAPNDLALTITIVVDIGPSGGKFENCATVSHEATAAIPPDSNLDNNKACVTTEVQFVPTTTYIYSAKVVCGTVRPPRPKPDIPTLRDPSPVVPGLYRTAVNIHNIWDETTPFQHKVAIALPLDQPRGPVTKLVDTKLGPNEALEVDCFNIIATLQGTTATKAEFLKGFLVIESPVELEVTAVYTAEELQENGISIDVEQIQPHIRRSKGTAATATVATALARP